MANCNLLLTSGDRFLQTSGSLLTLTSDCAAVAAVPQMFATMRENSTARMREHSTATWEEQSTVRFREPHR